MLLVLCGCRTSSTPDAVAGLYCKSVVQPNITYLSVNGIDLQLDAYLPARQLGKDPWVKFPDERKPVLLYIHGGGWSSLNRSIRNLNFLPYVEKGWAVVNIDYRLLNQAPFPACIADCRHALNWIYDNADKYKFDTSRIVVSGESAGGHLALMAGFLTNDAAFAIPGKPIKRELKVAAVINWFGVSDVRKLMEFWNSPSFVTNLVGDISKQDEIYRSCSPLTHINASVPPVLTIHGDADPVVPFIHATLLHNALNQCGVKNELHVVKGKKHGDFDEAEMSENFRVIWKFLDDVGINSATKRK
ncbi:MAG: alpha/beta hydrolase [Verrucomicrobiales bacterium]|nr:MAG: alpha/beta hydrolase [Verrucomicrobiales bacterium]